MGGRGSGRHSFTTSIDELQRLDIRELKRFGKLKSGWHGTISWSLNGKPFGNKKYKCFENVYVLNYRYKTNHINEWKPVTQRITLDKTECNFGGFRQWFICPGCFERVAVLCFGDTHFLCRKCYQLPYKSQLQIKADRLQGRATKIKEKLGINEAESLGRMVYDFDRPRYMHNKTFKQLKNKANSCTLKCIERLRQTYGEQAVAFL